MSRRSHVTITKEIDLNEEEDHDDNFNMNMPFTYQPSASFNIDSKQQKQLEEESLAPIRYTEIVNMERRNKESRNV